MAFELVSGRCKRTRQGAGEECCVWRDCEVQRPGWGRACTCEEQEADQARLGLLGEEEF